MLKEKKRIGFRFGRLNNMEKGMTNAFSRKNLTSKLCVVYLQVKLQENRCTCWLSNKNANKQQKVRYRQGNKHQTRCQFCFYIWKYLVKCLTDICRLCKSTSKIRRVSLLFKKLKISCKSGTSRLKIKSQSKIDVFRGWNA